jgi:bifunctional UDP-N-acetylglucosamine pyrophosphorylase/glucosamine-1-phosphate N-acetyltransferase
MASTSPSIAVIILAAGKGTRMKSGLAKVLHPLAGRPMLSFSLAAAESLNPERLVVVVGRDADGVREAFAGRATFALQEEQRGTGHAVARAEQALAQFKGDVLILYGDTPLIRPETLSQMIATKARTGADLVLLTAEIEVPGVVIRDAAGSVARIVEATDATPEELAIRERNTGVYLLSAELLWKALAQIGSHNKQGEVYLTDLVGISVRDGLRVEALRMADPKEATGVNTRVELAEAAAVLRRRKLEQLMLDGVTIVDPRATYIDVGVEVGRDSVIEPGCSIQAEIGPNAHLRPGCVLGRGVRIGNYVEIKNSVLGDGVKADHLSYIGDADVGARASFGCGAIIVNYNWREKSRTTVGEGARIGCNANLIAPVTIGRNAAVAAGSTIGSAVPDDALAIERARQRNIEGWAARRAARSGSGRMGNDEGETG